MIKIFNKNNFIDFSLVFLFPLLFVASHYYFHVFIWVAFVPIILLMHRNNFVRFWLYSFLVSMSTAFFLTFFMKVKLEYFILGLLFYGIVLIIFFLVCWFFYKKISSPFSALVLPTIWLFVVYLASLVNGVNFLFNTISCLQPMLFPLTWILGSQGMAFLVLLFNSLVALYILFRNKKTLNYIFAIVVTVIVCFVYSYLAVPTGKKIKVALIQGNIAKDWRWRIENSNTTILDTYKRLSLEAAKSKPDLIIWPEFAIPTDINYDEDVYNTISELAQETNANLLFGSTGRTEKTDPEYNYIKDVVYMFSRNGDYAGSYVAVSPFPYNGLIIPGSQLPVFTTDVGKFGITVCAEETFNFFNKNYVKSGADFLINVSNDEPIKSLNVRWLKSMYSRFSAAENHRYLLRVANTGYTEIINPYGKVEAVLEPNKEGILIADIYIK